MLCKIKILAVVEWEYLHNDKSSGLDNVTNEY
jgi:hypothetical protein